MTPTYLIWTSTWYYCLDLKFKFSKKATKFDLIFHFPKVNIIIIPLGPDNLFDPLIYFLKHFWHYQSSYILSWPHFFWKIFQFYLKLLCKFKKRVCLFFKFVWIYSQFLNWLSKNGHLRNNKLSEINRITIYILADPCGISKYNTWSFAPTTYFSYVNPAIREIKKGT